MTSTARNDPAHWRERAKEARAMGERMTDAVAKEAMLTVAAAYDKLCKRAEERMAKPSQLPL